MAFTPKVDIWANARPSLAALRFFFLEGDGEPERRVAVIITLRGASTCSAVCAGYNKTGITKTRQHALLDPCELLL